MMTIDAKLIPRIIQLTNLRVITQSRLSFVIYLFCSLCSLLKFWSIL